MLEWKRKMELEVEAGERQQLGPEESGVHLSYVNAEPRPQGFLGAHVGHHSHQFILQLKTSDVPLASVHAQTIQMFAFLNEFLTFLCFPLTYWIANLSFRSPFLPESLLFTSFYHFTEK